MRAPAATSKNLQSMRDLSEPMLGSQCICPTLDGWAGYLDGGAAIPADQMVVMGGAAFAVTSLAIIANQEVDLAGIGEAL